MILQAHSVLLYLNTRNSTLYLLKIARGVGCQKNYKFGVLCKVPPVVRSYLLLFHC